MRELYFKIVASTIYTMKNGNFMGAWKFMSLFILSINFMLNILSVWLIIDGFVYPGFTAFLEVNFIDNMFYNRLVYLFVYLFAPLFLLNYVVVFAKNRCELILSQSEKINDRKMFAIHFFGSFLVCYICLMINLFAK